MGVTLHSKSKTSRLAALLFFAIGFPAGAWGLFYVTNKVFVRGDAIATANNIVSNEFLFRTGILAHLLSNVAYVIMAYMFYRVFGESDKRLSRVMHTAVIAQLSIMVILELLRITALNVLSSSFMPSMPAEEKQHLAYLFLRMHGQGIIMTHFLGGIYWLGLGVLVYRSGMTPKIFGILFMISGAGYILDTCAYILLPAANLGSIRPFIRMTFVSGLLSMLWILFRGLWVPHRSFQKG